MRDFLAVDAGGTSTRAVLVDEEGRVHGFGRSTGGNPTSIGVDGAAAAVAAAARQALAASGVSRPLERVLLAHAGGGIGYHDQVQERLQPLGVHAPILPAGDLLALFCSGTAELDGAALIAGTGAIGGAIRDGAMHRVVDGTGWLLGDAGSGFWIGHHIARAVIDDLDGGPATALTPLVIERMGVRDDREVVNGRPVVLNRMVRALYDLRPVELARFAPLAFELVDTDDVARTLVRESVEMLAALLRRVRRFQAEGPLVFGGSVLVQGYLKLEPDLLAPLVDAAGDAASIPVADGLVGAAVLALRSAGIEVGAELFARLQTGITASTVRPV